MNPGLHKHTPRSELPKVDLPKGYAHELRQQVQTLRNKLSAENNDLRKECGERRKSRLQTLVHELRVELLGEFQRAWQEAEQARAAARKASAADRSTQVAQALRSSQELRQSMASAEKSTRMAGALSRAGRLAELREQTQALLSGARLHLQNSRNAAQASAEQDRNRRASFMQSMREQVTAMADAFQAEHQAHCEASKTQRTAVLWSIYDFVTTITGRPHPGSESAAAESTAPASSAAPAAAAEQHSAQAPESPESSDTPAEQESAPAMGESEPRKRPRSARNKNRA